MTRVGVVVVLALCALVGTVASAQAAEVSAPGWEVTPMVFPSHLKPGSEGYIVLAIYNIGKGTSRGPITVTDQLPAGVIATEAGYVNDIYEHAHEGMWDCKVGSTVACRSNSVLPEMQAGEIQKLAIAVKVPANASGTALNQVTVSGGGALTPASVSEPLNFESTPSAFGFENFDAWFSNDNGTIDTQAGSHPYSLTVSFTLNNSGARPSGEIRDVGVNLPRGLIGNPTVMPRCTMAQLNAEDCPADSQVGVDTVWITGGPVPLGFPEGQRPKISEEAQLTFMLPLPVYNMVPPPGVPAQLAFAIQGIGVKINVGVRSGSDYGLSNTIDNIPQREIVFNTITVWGDPAEPSHDWIRSRRVEEGNEESGIKSDIADTPFLTLPTSCEGPQAFTGSTDEWPVEGIEAPISEASILSHETSGVQTGITGCDQLSFDPSLTVSPDTSSAETPAGLTAEVKVPQEGLTAPGGLTTSNIKDTTVTLPEGVAINPGQAHGLAVCSQEQSALGTEGEPSCPGASKVGTDEIETPLLSHGVKGDIYVLDSNPPNLRLLVAASGEGVNLKLVGDVHLDGTTGRLTTAFRETPELPFTTFRLSFSGGAQAALYTPSRCGTYATSSDFTPWSEPAVSDAYPQSRFVINAGPNGSACPSGPLPFSPSLTAGSTTDQAGGFTDFSLLLTREDGQQRIGSLRFKTPEGLLGMISKVSLCPEAQANAGTCSPASQIGHTVVEAGPGPYPLVVPEPGQPPAPIYLTGGYKGAPYGLSIVVPLHVGPFTLQTQIVRARIEVDPITTQLTITTDPLPTIIDGIPADLRAINAVIDKPGFMFNPTGCEPGAFSGAAYGMEGSTAPISSHFQMGSCRSLTFKPNFKVSTSGKTSRAKGASLDAKILYPTGELGANQASSQSNVKMVKVDLPKQLPSRLTTLQKACTAATFEANPANCPADSKVGTATAITPVLPVELTGPAYFVSYGGAKFPELVVVLQGYGVTVFLHGETFISKAGITSSTFRQVPDVPITSFELKLPEGPFSALAANGNLCAKTLLMPTAFTGQNGAVIHQNTPVVVTGCAKHKTKKANKHNKKHVAGKKASRGK
ncbi:MAG: hypothetical protein WB998_12255 [Solirubrobacteraceae bacterium]